MHLVAVLVNLILQVLQLATNNHQVIKYVSPYSTNLPYPSGNNHNPTQLTAYRLTPLTILKVMFVDSLDK